MPESTMPSPYHSLNAQNQRLRPPHSPSLIASSQKIRDVKISPDGRYVLYQVTPFYRATERVVSELWLAECNVPRSARRLTSGEYNNRAGVFHPRGKQIMFLSDRCTTGKGQSSIYTLQLDRAGGDSNSEPVILTQENVQGFEISPDGSYVAFMSVGEMTEPEIQRGRDGNDARVFGSKDNLSRLRLYIRDLGTGEIRAPTNIRRDKYIESFTWSPDSSHLLYRLRENRGTEYTESEVDLESISISGVDTIPNFIGRYPRSPSGPNVWLSTGHIASLQNYEPENLLDARTIHIQHPLEDASQTRSNYKNTKRLYGEDEDAVRIVKAQYGLNHNQQDTDLLAVEVSNGTDTHIDIIALTSKTVQYSFTLFRTKDDAIWFNSWDAKRISGPNGEIWYVFAAVLSSGIRHEPPNVWAGCMNATNIGAISQKLQLSSHLKWLLDVAHLKTELIGWKAGDGIELSGLVSYPPGYHSGDGPRPTVLLIHGGPYRRDIPDYMPYFCKWRELCASAGYIVISPNYRGSQGRGQEFARAASAGIGTYDWPDCESMVDEAIRRGFTDPKRLGVGGWSHGGSLTAWGVTKTKDRFKAAIIGAGATNWESMVMESSSPELEAAIGKSVPWDHTCAAQESSRKKSPIHSVAGVDTAVLILHGEKDERVPLGQAIGLWRGLKRKATPRAQDAVELVVYPREQHG
ncbi:Alpha/Beta hydrolase protein [Flammula alnicola]|nr:Alpha/Beta hydrolase protein [Flammula alnicola]